MGSGTRDLREICLRDQGGRCWYCDDKLTTKTATLDHVIPRSRGGLTTLSNSVAACKFCNGLKGSRSHDDFLLAPDDPDDLPPRPPDEPDFGPQRY